VDASARGITTKATAAERFAGWMLVLTGIAYEKTKLFEMNVDLQVAGSLC
jgi:hypothetical protein